MSEEARNRSLHGNEGAVAPFAFTPPCVSLAADDWRHIPPKILFLLDVAVGAQTVMFWKFFFFFLSLQPLEELDSIFNK